MVRPRRGLLLRLVVTAALLGWFVSRVDWADIGEVLGHARWDWFGVALAAYGVGQLANGFGWRTLLVASGLRVGVGEMVRHDLASVFWSTLVPGGVAGEVVKGVRLARAGGEGGTVAVALVAARLCGGTMAGAVGLILLPWSAAAEAHPLATAGVMGAVMGAGLTGLLVLRAGRPTIDRLAPGLARRIPPGRFPPASALGGSMAATGVAHLAFAAMFAACFAATGHPVTIADGAWVGVVGALSQVVTVTVGGLGIRELVVTGLGAVLVPPDAAASAALLVTATFFGWVALGGLVEAHRAWRPS